MMVVPPENFEAWASRFSAKVLAFYVGLPILLAFLAVIGSGYVDKVGYDGALIYLLLVALPSWWLVSGLTQAVKVVLKPWAPPLWVLTAVGALLSGWPIFLYVMAISDLFHHRWPGGGQIPVWPWPQSPGDTVDLIIRTMRGGVTWIAANYLFDRFFGLPRYRYGRRASAPSEAIGSDGGQENPRVPEDSDSARADEHPFSNSTGPNSADAVAEYGGKPEILHRLVHASSAVDILAIKAEEHYVRVYTNANEELVLCRFSDAIADLDSSMGVRVHRSYWVNVRAIKSVERSDAKCEITLTNGQIIPVSQRYWEVVKQLVGR